MSGFCITRIVLFCNLLLFSLYLIMNVSLYHQALWQVTVSCGLTDKPSVSFKCRVFGQYVSSCYSSTSGAGMVFTGEPEERKNPVADSPPPASQWFITMDTELFSSLLAGGVGGGHTLLVPWLRRSTVPSSFLLQKRHSHHRCPGAHTWRARSWGKTIPFDSPGAVGGNNAGVRTMQPPGLNWGPVFPLPSAFLAAL